ncbi:MAG: hypothetical protein IJ265_01905 [Oscillospiraceae bacterium]|nr:hypothetical protein [Oscillospiraceae bacterium]MBQ8010291.1 hypothetical protein [Oscillospiraceae bacterium]
MPDKFDGLEDFAQPTYTAPEKKGAPQIEAPELDDILAPPPAAWTPQNDQRKGAPVVDEPVLLDDPAPVWQSEKKGAPQVDEPVLLEEPASYTEKPAAKPQELAADLQADILGDAPAAYDPVEEFYQKLKFTDDLKAAFSQLDAEKQMQVTEMRAKQMGIPVPAVPRELRPKLEQAAPAASGEEAAVEAPVLEEAPKPQAYVPKFKDEDLERAKEESKKPQKYTPPPQMEMTEEQKKESRRIMNELREEREREAAKKGFRQLILLTVLGLVAGAAFALFVSGAFGAGYRMEEELGWMSYVKEYGVYLGAGVAIGSLVLCAPIPALRGIVKFLHGLTFVLCLFPGIPLLIQKEAGHGLLNGLLYAAALVLSGLCAFTLTTSENISMYNKYGNS